MARPRRQLVSGGTYHLTSRGVEKRSIFHDDVDRRRFVRRLANSVSDRGVSCLSYCLMGNHVHLILRGEAEQISSAMRDLLGGHARYFNKRYERSGHLFGARFHHVHVTTDEQVHAALRYVALNPVRAGLVEHPRDWPWSSFAALTAGLVEPGSVDLEALGLLLLGNVSALTTVAAALATTVEVGLLDARLSAVASAG